MADIQIYRRTGSITGSTPRGAAWLDENMIAPNPPGPQRVNIDVIDEVAKDIERAGLTVEVK